jgi:hypothetical protein
MVPASDPPQRDPLLPDKVVNPAIGRRRGGVPGLPHLPYGKVFQYCPQAAYVVRLRMGKDDDIESPHPTIPEVRCDDPFPDVESIVEAPTAVH